MLIIFDWKVLVCCKRCFLFFFCYLWVMTTESVVKIFWILGVRLECFCSRVSPSLRRGYVLKCIIFTQFYFWTTQNCKRYLKLAFKYLVLFRRRNVSLVPFRAIMTLPLPPWEFATAISVEEGPVPTTSSIVCHPWCTYDSTCKRPHKNPMNTWRVLAISLLRNSVSELPPGKIRWRMGEQARAQSQAFTPA